MNLLKASRRYLKYLAWLGLLLATAGLVSGVITGWTPLPIALLVAGIGLILVGLAYSDMAQGRFWQQRSTEAGANALVGTLAVLVILGVINWLSVQYSAHLDLTENQIFTLAPQTREITQALDQPIRLVIFDTSPNAQDEELLQRYHRLNPQFDYEYVNPYANPRLAQEFEATRPGMVFLEVGDQRQFLQQLGPEQRLSERTLTNAIDRVIRDRTLTVYFLQGHGEYSIDGSGESSYTQAATSLDEKNYTVETLNLAETEAVPEDASVVVVAGPAQEFFDPEVERLSTYLEQGGGLLLLLDPQTNPGLAPLLDDWGITLDDRLVLDTSGAGQLVGLGPAAPLVTDYGDHPISRDFHGGRSFYPLARPIQVQEVPGVTATPLLQTNPQSQAQAISATGELQFDPEAPAEGPFTLGVALSRSLAEETTAEAEEPPEARLVVIGNASFASDGLFEQQLNGDVFLNAINWLGQQSDSTLSIRPKEVTDRRITLTAQQQVGLGVFAILVLPLVGGVLAVVMWLRRR